MSTKRRKRLQGLKLRLQSIGDDEDVPEIHGAIATRESQDIVIEAINTDTENTNKTISSQTRELKAAYNEKFRRNSVFTLNPNATSGNTLESKKKKLEAGITDDEDGLVRIRLADLPWGARWLAFADTVSVVGLKYAVDAHATNLRRVLWASLVALGVGFMVYQIYEMTNYYRSYPVKTSIAYERIKSLPFPAVTICNENLIASSRAQFNNFDDLIVNIYPPYPDPTFTPNFTSFEPMFDYLRDINFDWQEAWYYFSHTYNIEHWLKQCTFNGESCINDTKIVLTPMGYCFQFNGEGEIQRSRLSGSKVGLQILMDAFQWEYLYSRSRGAGFRVMLHSRDSYPLMNEKGTRLTPGSQTSLAVTLTNLTLLEEPYGNCRAQEGYDFERCLSYCGYRFVAEQCGCRLWYSDLDGVRACDPQEMYECADDAFENFGVNYYESGFAEKCNCPAQCSEMQYNFDLSTNILSDFALTTIARELISQYICTNESDPLTCYYDPPIDQTVVYMRSNVVDVEIYIKTMTLENVKEQPAYTFLSFLCDIGGAMGLILGSTILTIIELAEFITLITIDAVYFKLVSNYIDKKKKVQVWPGEFPKEKRAWSISK